MKTNSFYEVDVCLVTAIIEPLERSCIRPLINFGLVVTVNKSFCKTYTEKWWLGDTLSFWGKRPISRPHVPMLALRRVDSILSVPVTVISDTICYKTIWKVDSKLLLRTPASAWDDLNMFETQRKKTLWYFPYQSLQDVFHENYWFGPCAWIAKKNPAIQLRIILDGFPKNGKFGNSQYQKGNTRFLNHQQP